VRAPVIIAVGREQLLAISVSVGYCHVEILPENLKGR
jgi:hypothetical protein